MFLLMHRMRRILLAFLSLFAFVQVSAQNVGFDVETPGVVPAGEIFTVVFQMTNAKIEDFTPPSFEGFNVVAGPMPISGKSTTVDLNTNKVVNITTHGYSYGIMAPKEGVYTIGAAKATTGGKTYTTKSMPVEVVSAEAVRSPRSTTVAPDDIFLRAAASRNSVYKGEPVKIDFKVYSRLPIGFQPNPKFPAFNGFWVQDLNSESKWLRETYNGKVYQTLVIKEALLYPQQAGKLYIDQASIGVIAQIMTESRSAGTGDPFLDNLLGGGADVSEVRKTISSQPIQITVKELPANAPASFSGAVGNFQISGSLSSSTLSANASGVYTLKISGTGNLPLISSPKISLPASFEPYNVKTTENTNARSSGISGFKEFEYPFIARAEGSYTIEPLEFSYFDPESGRYLSLSTRAQSIDIRPDSTGSAIKERGIVSGMNKEEVKVLDSDIRFIRMEAQNFRKKGIMFFMSPLYFALLVAIAGIFTGAYFYMRKYLRDIANTTFVRNKKANKVAMQRLKSALGYLEKSEERGFYEEMLRALWGYMSDKLNIPIANLTKDNIREELLKRGIPAERTGEFIEIISDCEYAQYSPQSSKQMNDVYNSAVVTLSRFESMLK